MTDWQTIYRSCTVVENREIARGSRWIKLHADDEHPVPYEPGHVLSLRMTQGEWQMRHAYTITWADADERTFNIIYRVIPNGRMTPKLALLEAGAKLEFSGVHHNPIRHEVNAGARAIVGIATGTGVGPLYGYFRYVLERGLEKRPCSLYIGFREEADIGPRAELDALASKFPNFKWAPTLTQPTPEWRGLRGRVTESVPPLIAKPRETHFHLVGNGAMIVEMEAALSKVAVPNEHVSDEYYFNWNAEAADEVATAIAGRFAVKATG